MQTNKNGKGCLPPDTWVFVADTSREFFPPFFDTRYFFALHHGMVVNAGCRTRCWSVDFFFFFGAMLQLIMCNEEEKIVVDS
jgi:hypothetical protein